ncbi:MAG: gamma-glutamylcyclotransferase family protein [Promethearchaeota archaeon]
MGNMKIFGYGTFITSEIYRNFQNVRAAFLSGYIRIQRPLDPFPFILKSGSDIKSKGFWGLVFEVDQKGLAQLDFYEGMLYSRIPVSVLYSDGINEEVMVYYPTKETISDYQLVNYISDDDPWRKRIVKRHREILERFPELEQKTPPKV